MEFRKILALRGPNVWASFPVLEAWLDLGELNDVSSEMMPGFNERLMGMFPSMIEHRCSIGERGGFFERLRRGTYLAHILEHVTLELQSLAGTEVGYGRARDTSEHGVYRVVVEYKEEALVRACIATGRELCLALVHNQPFDLEAEMEKLRNIAHKVCLGPSTRAIVEAATARGIPFRRMNEDSLVQLGYGANQRRICTAETDQTGAIAEWIAQDKELTRSLLRGIGVPVPTGRYVDDAEDAWEAAQEIGGPVVVKPRYGNQGRGVATNLTTREQVLKAYEAAKKEGPHILVESFAPGDDYRLLVIGDRMIAAAVREPANVIGDGKSTITELVAVANRDPRRSDGHSTSLSKMKLDANALLVLEDQGYTAESTPAEGVKVLIRRNANLSTGGSATDITDNVHPDVAARAIEAAKMIGLDIAGVDVIASDISRPLEEQGGVIVEVNAGPGLRMHLEPSAGKPRPVGEAIVGMLFPEEKAARIPIAAVTGTNGKTTTTRLISQMFKQAGRKVGMTCTDGIYLNDRRIDVGDCAGPQSARAVLMNPMVEAAVLETARGGIVRAGLGFDRCDVAVVCNIGEGDHLGMADIDTVDKLAKVKRVIVEAVSPDGAAVLNANDPLTVEMAKYCPGAVIYFALDEQHPVVQKQRHDGGRVVFVRGNDIVLAGGEFENLLISLDRVPFTYGGRISFQVENALAAVAAGWSLGISHESIRAGLETFTADTRQAPGRFNMLHAGGATVIIDYGHNVSALNALIGAIERLPHDRRSIVYTAAGDRRDCDIIAQGKVLGDAFDQIVIYEDACTRGRADGEVIRLMRQGLAQGKRTSQIVETRGEQVAIAATLDELRPGDVIVIQADTVDKSIAFVQSYLREKYPLRESNMSASKAPAIEVREGPLGKSVHAARTIEKGELILSGWGPQSPTRTRHSLQVDHDKHIIINTEIELINHSCEPNCGVMIRREAQALEIHALRQINAGEELFTDYATFEWEMLFLGKCLCGAPSCRGEITGFKDMPESVRESYGPYIAEYLQELEVAAGSRSR